MGGTRRLGGLLLLAGVAFLLGCGGSDATTAPDAAVEAVPYPWVKGVSREFLVMGKDNAVQTYGRDATTAEREQASKQIQGWMRARAAKDWERDCEYFSRDYAKRLAADANRVTSGKVKTCPQALAHFGSDASGDYKNTLDGPIDSFRIKEGLGFVQYHGIDHKDYVVSMQKEEGKWWVSNARPLGRFE